MATATKPRVSKIVGIQFSILSPEEIRKGAGSRRIEQFVNDLILGGEHKEVDSEVIQSDSGQVFAMWKT